MQAYYLLLAPKESLRKMRRPMSISNNNDGALMPVVKEFLDGEGIQHTTTLAHATQSPNTYQNNLEYHTLVSTRSRVLLKIILLKAMQKKQKKQPKKQIKHQTKKKQKNKLQKQTTLWKMLSGNQTLAKKQEKKQIESK